jgi:hypothetical protein
MHRVQLDFFLCPSARYHVKRTATISVQAAALRRSAVVGGPERSNWVCSQEAGVAKPGLPVTVSRYHHVNDGIEPQHGWLYPAKLLFMEPSSLSHFESGVEIWGEHTLA